MTLFRTPVIAPPIEPDRSWMNTRSMPIAPSDVVTVNGRRHPSSAIMKLLSSSPDTGRPSTRIGFNTTSTDRPEARATDPDDGDSLTYSLTDSANGLFEIDSETGVVTLVEGDGIAYEALDPPNALITVVSAD